MAQKDLYVIELAQTVEKLFAEGKIDPSADEIVTAHFGGKSLGGEIIDGARKRLKKLRYILEADMGIQTSLLRRSYYTLDRRATPAETEEEARICIATGGKGAFAWGIRKLSGDEDLYWRCTMQRNLLSGSAKVKKNVDRTLDAVQKKKMSQPNAGRLLIETRDRMVPRRQALAEKSVAAAEKFLEGE